MKLWSQLHFKKKSTKHNYKSETNIQYKIKLNTGSDYDIYNIIKYDRQLGVVQRS